MSSPYRVSAVEAPLPGTSPRRWPGRRRPVLLAQRPPRRGVATRKGPDHVSTCIACRDRPGRIRSARRSLHGVRTPPRAGAGAAGSVPGRQPGVVRHPSGRRAHRARRPPLRQQRQRGDRSRRHAGRDDGAAGHPAGVHPLPDRLDPGHRPAGPHPAAPARLAGVHRAAHPGSPAARRGDHRGPARRPGARRRPRRPDRDLRLPAADHRDLRARGNRRGRPAGMAGVGPGARVDGAGPDRSCGPPGRRPHPRARRAPPDEHARTTCSPA